MFHIRRLRPAVLVSVGVLAGAAAGIGGAAAASNGSSTTTTTTSSSSATWPPGPAAASQRLGQVGKRLQAIGAGLDRLHNEIQAIGIDGPPVHQDLVVPSTGGGFETVTIDSGTLKSVSGRELTIDEGYGGKTYKTVTITVPSNASVDRNFNSASLSDLKAGDHVSIARSSKGAHVTAFDSQHAPRRLVPGSSRSFRAPRLGRLPLAP
jgi:hypothetical protein